MVQGKVKKILMGSVSAEKKGIPFKRYLREFFDLAGLVRNLLRNRELIRMMTWRDFSAKYRGSVGGLFWSLIHPLVMMGVYTIVFSIFLKVRFSTDANPLTFSVYLLCGLLPWNALSQGLSQSAGVIRSNVNLVKRVVFPFEIFPLNMALSASIQQVIGFLLLLPLVWWVNGHLYLTLLLLPVILGAQLLLATGLNWIVACLAVYLPDMGQLISLVLTMWMFLTPIFYPEDLVPQQFLILFRLNPMAQLINLYRGVFMAGQFYLDSMIVTLIFCFFVFLFGYFWFMHSKKGFADVL